MNIAVLMQNDFPHCVLIGTDEWMDIEAKRIEDDYAEKNKHSISQYAKIHWRVRKVPVINEA